MIPAVPFLYIFSKNPFFVQPIHVQSAGQLSRLRSNAPISSHTIDTLCRILDCRVEDIMTYHPDNDV